LTRINATGLCRNGNDYGAAAGSRYVERGLDAKTALDDPGLDLGGRARVDRRPVAAQAFDPNFPVCLRVYQSFVDFYNDCSFTSMAQCQMSASGRHAECMVNPFYAPATRSQRRVHRRQRRVQ
jgi:hypothetical protein